MAARGTCPGCSKAVTTDHPRQQDTTGKYWHQQCLSASPSSQRAQQQVVGPQLTLKPPAKLPAVQQPPAVATKPAATVVAKPQVAQPPAPIVDQPRTQARRNGFGKVLDLIEPNQVTFKNETQNPKRRIIFYVSDDSNAVQLQSVSLGVGAGAVNGALQFQPKANPQPPQTFSLLSGNSKVVRIEQSKCYVTIFAERSNGFSLLTQNFRVEKHVVYSVLDKHVEASVRMVDELP